MNVASTNKWIVLRESEETLACTKYVGDDNGILENIITTMKNEQRVGEDMLKKRVAAKKAENPDNFTNIPSGVKPILEPSSRQLTKEEIDEHRQRRLDMLESAENVPVLINKSGLVLDKGAL